MPWLPNMLAEAQLARLLAPSTTEASELLVELAELGGRAGWGGRGHCWLYCMGWEAARSLEGCQEPTVCERGLSQKEKLER